MKQTILLFLATLLATACATSRSRREAREDVPHYRPWSQFGTDTAAYLEQNVNARKYYYVGKPFKLLLDELELPVLDASLSVRGYKYHGRGKNSSGYFYFYDKEDAGDAQARDKEFFPALIVYFTPPYLDNEVAEELFRKYQTDWNPEARRLMEKLVIQDALFVNLNNLPGKELRKPKKVRTKK